MGYSCNNACSCYYGDKGETVDGKLDISLYNWEEHEKFIVQITPIGNANSFYTTEVVDGNFTVYGEGKFYWIVHCSKRYKEEEYSTLSYFGF